MPVGLEDRFHLGRKEVVGRSAGEQGELNRLPHFGELGRGLNRISCQIVRRLLLLVVARCSSIELPYSCGIIVGRLSIKRWVPCPSLE